MKIKGQRLLLAMEKSGVSLAQIADVSKLTYTRVWQLATSAESHVSKEAGMAIAECTEASEAFLEGRE